MDEKKLTKKQTVVLQYIKKYVVSHGYAPTVREICQGLSLSSPATVHSHLSQLEGKGFIRKGKGKFRTIEVLCENEFVPKNEEVVKVPLLGKVTAGTPIEAIETPDEYFAIPTNLINPKKEKTLEETVEAALKQIEDKGYDAELVKRGVKKENIHHYGFAFKGKKVLIG